MNGNGVDIFAAGRPVHHVWASFKNVGDAYQGTYIGFFDAVSQKFGQEQVVYELLQKDGSVVNVGINKTAKHFHEKMKKIRFGQIVGIRFDKEVPSDKTATGKAKAIEVYADSGIVDAAWLKQREEVRKLQGGDPQMSDNEEMEEPAEAFGSSQGVQMSEDVVDEPFPSKPVAPTAPVAPVVPSTAPVTDDAAKLRQIVDLAKAKIGATNAQQVKDLVQARTGFTLIPNNFDQIILALTIL